MHDAYLMFYSPFVAMSINKFSNALILLKYSFKIAVACLIMSVLGWNN